MSRAGIVKVASDRERSAGGIIQFGTIETTAIPNVATGDQHHSIIQQGGRMPEARVAHTAGRSECSDSWVVQICAGHGAKVTGIASSN